MTRKPTFLAKTGVKRTMPKNHFFRSILQQRKTKRHRAQVGAMEEEAPSSRIVRALVILLLLHILFIGGVCLQGHLTKTSPGVVQPKGMSLPPSVHAGAVPTVQSAPAAPAAAATPAAPADEIHITDASTIAPPAPSAANAPAPAAQSSHPGVQAGSAVHLVRSGETWAAIAAANGCSEADLKAVNPQMASMASPMSGERLSLPAKPGEVIAVAEEAEEDAGADFYVLQKGETLSKVARMHKTTVPKLMALNKLTDKDARRLRPGTKLQVSGDAPVAAPAAAPAADPGRVAAAAPNRSENIIEAAPASPAAVPAQADPVTNGVYVLKKGETLAAVARKHHMSLSRIMALNKLTDKSARRLQPGAKIKVSR